jgi:segregation and condensation protein B
MSSSKGKKKAKKSAGNKPSSKLARKAKEAASAEAEAAADSVETASVEAADGETASAETAGEHIEAEQRTDAAEAEAASSDESTEGGPAGDGEAEASVHAAQSADSIAEADAIAADAEQSDDDAPIEPPSPSAPVVDLPRSAQKRLVESLVFVSDRAITAQQLGRMLKIKSALAKELADELTTDYEGRGIELVELSGGYQFRSAPSSAHIVREHIAQPPVRLTRAQLETLALVAYRQPITRPEIDDVRGVDSGSALRVLLERGLLKMLGRKDEPGRPLLYGTTPFFLDFFGMRSLKDLPTLREFTELSDENRALFKKKTGETIEEAEAALLAAEEAAQRDSLAAPKADEADGEVDGERASEGEGAPETRLADDDSVPPDQEVVADRDLEVEAETFAAGSLQTSPDNGAQVERDGEEADAEDEERDLPPAPEA